MGTVGSIPDFNDVDRARALDRAEGGERDGAKGDSMANGREANMVWDRPRMIRMSGWRRSRVEGSTRGRSQGGMLREWEANDGSPVVWRQPVNRKEREETTKRPLGDMAVDKANGTVMAGDDRARQERAIKLRGCGRQSRGGVRLGLGRRRVKRSWKI